jgi:hypothetical protein
MNRVSLSELVNRMDRFRWCLSDSVVSSEMFDLVYSIAIRSPPSPICFDVVLVFLQGCPHHVASTLIIPLYYRSFPFFFRRFNHVPTLGNYLSNLETL